MVQLVAHFIMDSLAPLVLRCMGDRLDSCRETNTVRLGAVCPQAMKILQTKLCCM